MPKLKRTKDKPTTDPYPLVNDWFEALILFIAGLAIFGGVAMLYHLSEAVS